MIHNYTLDTMPYHVWKNMVTGSHSHERMHAGHGETSHRQFSDFQKHRQFSNFEKQGKTESRKKLMSQKAKDQRTIYRYM